MNLLASKMQFRNKIVLRVVLACVLLAGFVPNLHAGARGVAAPAVTLDLSSSSVPAGTPVTLTATVTYIGLPVHPGSISFCDAAAAHCSGPALLGTAQLKADGTAALKLILPVGTHSLKAIFAGTKAVLAGFSTPQTLTVTGNGNYHTSTAIQSAGAVGNYTLTGTVTSFGEPVPTGSVSFLDTTNGNASLGAVDVSGATVTTGLGLFKQYTFVGGPSEMAVGDFNNDGIPDVVVVDYGDSLVRVMLGNGDGTFQPSVTYGSGLYQPGSVVVGDFNSDGNLDFAISSQMSGPHSYVIVFLGNGDGTFQPQVNYQIPEGTAAVLNVGDFNNDGILDIAVTSYNQATVGVMLGNGDGTFQPQITAPTGRYPWKTAVADLNGDGNLDLIVGETGSPAIAVFLGNGDGTFQPEVVYSLGPPEYWVNPNGLVAGDFNGDGKPDVAFTESSGGSGVVGVMLGNGDGTLQSAVNYPISTGAGNIVAADFNSDGNLDLAFCWVNSVALLPGNGDGTFGSQVSYSTDNGPVYLAAADLNGDGMMDLLVSQGFDNLYQNNIDVLMGQRTQMVSLSGVSVPGSGTHYVDATYPGDANYAASTSSTVGLTASGTTGTTTTLAVLPAGSIVLGQTVQLTATISPSSSGGNTATGTVTFYAGGVAIGSDTLANGQAVLDTSALASGGHSLSAHYSGDAHFAASVSPAVSLTVLLSTTNSLTASASTVVVGNPVTFTATVAGNGVLPSSSVAQPAGAVMALPMPTPTGNVTFFNGTTMLGTAALNSGVATYTTSALLIGTASITANYAGDTNFAGSTSAAVAVIVTAVPDFAITVNPAAVSVAAGQAGASLITITPQTGFSSQVTFSASGLPNGASISFSPASVNCGGSSLSSNITIQTASLTAASRKPHLELWAFVSPAMGIVFFALPGSLRRSTAQGRARLAGMLLLGLLAIVILAGGVAGCGGGFGQAPVARTATATTYHITITGTSGTTQHSTVIALTVQ